MLWQHCKICSFQYWKHFRQAIFPRHSKQDGQNIHHTTVEKYYGIFGSKLLFYKVNRFDLKGKKQLATQEKYYLVDVGLLNILAGKERITDRGTLLENIVYFELLRRGNKVWTGTARNTRSGLCVQNHDRRN